MRNGTGIVNLSIKYGFRGEHLYLGGNEATPIDTQYRVVQLLNGLKT